MGVVRCDSEVYEVVGLNPRERSNAVDLPVG